MKRFVMLAVVLAVALALTGCATRIAPGEAGIKVSNAGSNRGVQDVPAVTGWVFYTPGFSDVIAYPTNVQTAVWTANPNEGSKNNEEVCFSTKDSMQVCSDISLSYHLTPDKVPAFYLRFKTDDLNTFTHGFLRNIARDAINELGGKYTVEQVMGDNAELIANTRKMIDEQVKNEGVVLDQFGFIGRPRPPKEVENAINAKVEASQVALKVQNEVMSAEAEAKKRVALAEGEAEANRKLTQSLSPQLLEWRKLAITEQAVQKWDGARPMVEGNSSGLLLNVNPK